jgi:hypothetical protein
MCIIDRSFACPRTRFATKYCAKRRCVFLPTRAMSAAVRYWPVARITYTRGRISDSSVLAPRIAFSFPTSHHLGEAVRVAKTTRYRISWKHKRGMLAAGKTRPRLHGLVSRFRSVGVAQMTYRSKMNARRNAGHCSISESGAPWRWHINIKGAHKKLATFGLSSCEYRFLTQITPSRWVWVKCMQMIAELQNVR